MAKPITHPADRCSYELHQPHRQSWIQRRHQLLLGLWLTCSGFTWPGRVPHLSYQATHGTVQERVDALRLLEEYPGQATRDACLAALEDGASEVRTQAARCVGAGGDERATTNLLDLADAKVPAERAAALEALGRIAPTRGLSSLERALSESDPVVRAAAVRALSAYVRAGSFDSGKLMPLLSVEPVAVRLAAVEVLSAASTTQVLQLRAAARDAAAEVRVAALRALGKSRDAKLLPDLSAALSDADESVRLAAIAALGDSQLSGATALLRNLSSARSAPIRAARAALAALGRMDDPGALPPIAAALGRSELSESAALALVARAQRINRPETYEASVAALERAIEVGDKPPTAAVPSDAGAADAALDSLARALTELAPFCDLRGAVASLVRALAAGRGEVEALTQHLLGLPRQQPDGTQLLAALLTRDPARSPRLPEAVLAVLSARGDAPSLVATHREQLLRLADGREATTRAALALHALLHIGGGEPSLGARQALAALWAEQPGLAREPAHTERLIRWLDDTDAAVREHSSIALAGAADTATLQALSVRLEQGAPHPELTLQACAGAIVRASKPSALRERLLQQFQRYLNQSDETVAMSAIFALRAAADQRSAPWIAGLLRGGSPQLRAAAIQSLAGFDGPEARRMLRDMLRGDNVHNASNAALALAEIGTDRDVDALLRAAERGSWPLPPSAAYAAARITARGVTRKHSLERVLCRFAQLRDRYVLSNIVSALAALGADACDAHIQPTQLLDPTLPSSVRAAAALWLQSTRPHSAQDAAERAALLARCASDHDSSVAAACKPSPAQSAPPGQALVQAFEPDAHTSLSNRLVALRHPDGTVFVAQSDNTGRVYLPRTAPNELRLEDPADQGPVALPARDARAP